MQAMDIIAISFVILGFLAGVKLIRQWSKRRRFKKDLERATRIVKGVIQND